MKVDFTNPNIIVSTSRKTSFRAQANTPVANQPTAEEARYNKAVAIGAISVLAGLGLAMIHKEKIVDFVSCIRKKLSGPKAEIRPLPRAHGGPDIDITKGKTAIADAWDGYINDIETRVTDKHNSLKTVYARLFKNQAEQLDKYEAIAQERALNQQSAKLPCCA